MGALILNAIEPRPADDARERGCGSPPSPRLVQACDHRREPDPAEQARWYGPETPVLEWRARLVCSKCGSRDVDMVVSGARRRPLERD
jgi:hypothetical protein